MRFRTIDLEKDPEGVARGRRDITSLIDYDAFRGVTQHEDESTGDAGGASRRRLHHPRHRRRPA